MLYWAFLSCLVAKFNYVYTTPSKLMVNNAHTHPHADCLVIYSNPLSTPFNPCYNAIGDGISLQHVNFLSFYQYFLVLIMHASHLEQVLKSFIVVLSCFKSREINSLKILNLLEVCKTNTQ